MDFIFTLYNDTRTVFRLKDVAMLTGEKSFNSLNMKLNYYVRTGRFQNPRKGLYCKSNYNPQELACRIFAPAYISLEYVLQRAGVIFQYYSAITNVSYLSREIKIDNQAFQYRQMKGEILTNTAGIILNKDNINIATPERAFLDILYLNGRFYFDNLHALNKQTVAKLLPIYNSQTLVKYVNKLFSI